MLTNFTEMVDGFPEKVDRRRAFFPLREIHKSGRFDCPGAGLGESDKSFLRYRRLRAMDWFMLTQGFVLPLREIHKSGRSFPMGLSGYGVRRI